MKKALIFLCAFLLTVPALAAETRDLTWTNLFYSAVKFQSDFDYESSVDSYMKHFRGDVWRRYVNDEFELNDKRQESLKMFKSQVAAFDTTAPYIIHTTFNFGNYDFKQHLFPLQALTPTTYFYASTSNSYQFPYRYEVYFSNPGVIGDLKMPTADAKNFLEHRKSAYGSIDRTVYAVIQFQLTGMKGGSKDELVAKITHFTIANDKNMQQVLLHQ